MKFLAALLLVVASVHANSLHSYGWASGKESVFHLETQVLTGIPEIEQQFAGLKLTSRVRVQSYSDYTLRIKLEEPKFTTFNGKINLNEAGRIIREGGERSGKQSHIPEDNLRFLEEPFIAHMRSGMVESFEVSREEPVSVTNIKRSLLAQIHMDLSGSQRTQLESNHIQFPVSEERELNERISYFETSEESLHGECNTAYTIHRLPEYRAKELEEMWTLEERQLEQGLEGYRTSISDSVSSESSICEGKKYYQVIKTRNFDNCKVRPIYQKMNGLEGCDISRNNCGNLMAHLSTSTYYICGELQDFNVRKVDVQNTVMVNPLGFNTDEKIRTTTLMSLKLLTTQRISQRFPSPSSPRRETSLIYEYPPQRQTQMSEEVIKMTEEILGTRPIIPQPGLTEAPLNLVPIKFARSEIIPSIVEELKKLVDEMHKSPESCSSKKDVAGMMTTISQFLRHLSLEEIKQVEGQVESKAQKKMLYDILAIVGTNPSTMVMINRIKQQDVPSSLRRSWAKSTLRSVRTPTRELVHELIKLVKQLQSEDKMTMYTVITHLSDLIYHSWINPTTMVANYPSKLYGIFGSKESTVLIDEYIPFLTEQLSNESRGEEERKNILIITALGKLGHIKALKPMLKSLKDITKEPMYRSIIVYSLKRVSKRNPTELRPILMSLINNPVEVPEVRIAAVAVLPWSQPTQSDLQKLAVRTWFEPSKQVSSFIGSTLRSLSFTEVPELKPIGVKAKPVLTFLKPEFYGIQYSQNYHLGKFIEYLKTSVSQKFMITNTKSGLIPSKLGYKIQYHGDNGVTKIRGVSFNVYTQGMDALIEKYLHYFGKSTKTSPQVKEQLEKIVSELEIQTRKLRSSKAVMQYACMGWESTYLWDYETVMEGLEYAARKLESESNFEYSIIAGRQVVDVNGLGITDAGLPFVFQFTLPTVVSAKGYVKTIPESGRLFPTMKWQFVPVLNAKMQAQTGILSPFTKEFVGAGVEVSVHSSIPIEAEAKITRGEIDLTVKTPSETEQQETETLHAFVMPFTVRKNVLKVKPLSAGEMKMVVSPNKPRKMSFDIGRSLGLKAELEFESDSKFIDLYSYIEKIRQTSVDSLLPVMFIPSSIRLSSTKVKYHPRESQTKEFTLNIKLSSNGHGFSGSKILSSISKPINREEIESNGYRNLKYVLSQLESSVESSSATTIVELSAGLKGSNKIVKTALVFGKKTEHSGHKIKTFAAFDIKQNDGQVFGIKYEGKVEIPKIEYRWNKEQLLNQNMELRFEGKIVESFGQYEREIKVDGKLLKTEEQKNAIRQSPEWQKCTQLESEGMRLSPVCMMVRNQAGSLNKVVMSVEVPEAFARSPLVTLAEDMLRSLLLGQITEWSESELQQQSSGRSTMRIEALIGRVSDVAQVKVVTPSETLKIRNLRINGWTQNLLPLNVRNPLGSALVQRMSRYHAPASCRIEPRMITTFDNKTFEYRINDCEHLLLADGSKQFPVAVLTRTVQDSKKIVKILSGVSDIKLVPESGSGLKVTIDGQPVEIAQGQRYKKESSGVILVEIMRYNDNVYLVNIPPQALTVLTDGKLVEVVAPQILRSRSVGVCGDLNGEVSADIKSPKMCVMRPKIGAISYMLNKDGNSQSKIAPKCSGIPSSEREEYQREARECAKERYINTPVMNLYWRLRSFVKPVVSAHLVEKQRNQLCISRQMIKICSGLSVSGGLSEDSFSGSSMSSGSYVSKPLSLKPKVVDYVCIPRPSSISSSLEKRARSGEPLNLELESLPVAFRKTEFEPVLCGKPSFESSVESESFSSERKW